LQMLRLRWFDAGADHNFNTTNDGVYDWVIDTRACDYGEWFSCHGPDIWGAYTNYKLPQDVNDWRVNIFPSNITIEKRNLQIYPNKDPTLAWSTWAVQINPYIRLKIRVRLYGGARYTKINPATLSWYVMDLQTTFNIKTYY
jgi:hypothetical protein